MRWTHFFAQNAAQRRMRASAPAEDAENIEGFITKPTEVTRLMENLQIPNLHPPPKFLSAEKSDPHYWDAA